MTDLATKSCRPCEGGVPTLAKEHVRKFLLQVEAWELNRAGTEIHRSFRFRNYHQVMAFVNAVAWVAHRENHHPDLEVSYDCCMVRFTTHAINGLSENDFICAAKIDLLQAKS